MALEVLKNVFERVGNAMMRTNTKWLQSAELPA